jgi:hypothetical protein
MTRNRSSLTPEESLLLGAASRAASVVEPPDDAGSRAFREFLRGRFDWPKFLYLARRQKCLAAVYRFVRDFGLEDMLPAGIAEVLKNEDDLAQGLFAKKLAELKMLMEALRNEGIEALVIKGIPLAVRLYADPAVRVTRDIDLLCNNEDLDRAERVIEALGYSNYEGRISKEEYREHHYHVIYVRGEQGHSVVEVHWNLRSPIKGDPIDMSALLRRRTIIDIDGAAVATLDDLDALWQLGVNLSFEGFLDLRDLGDVRRLSLKIRADDWARLGEFSRNTGTFNEMSAALAVAERAFGRFVPQDARRKIRPNFLIREMLLPTYLPRGIVWRWTPFRDTHALAVNLFLRKGIRRKLAYLYRLACPTRGSLIESRASQVKPSGRWKSLRFHAAGAWILLKVSAIAALLAFLVRTKLIGRRGLDPEGRLGSRTPPVF